MFYCLLWFIHPISVKRPIFPLFKLYLILPILLFKFTKFQFTRLQAISVPDFSWRLKVTPAKSVFYFDLEGSVARQPPFFVRASYVIPTFRGYLLPLKHRERFATLNPIANKPARVTVTQTCYRGWLGVRSCGDCVNPMRGGHTRLPTGTRICIVPFIDEREVVQSKNTNPNQTSSTVVPVHAMKVYSDSGSIALLFFILGTRWAWLVKFTPR